LLIAKIYNSLTWMDGEDLNGNEWKWYLWSFIYWI